MQNKPAPSTEIRRAERKDIGTLVRMRIALLQEVGNLRSQADSKQLIGAIRSYFKKELPSRLVSEPEVEQMEQ